MTLFVYEGHAFTPYIHPVSSLYKDICTGDWVSNIGTLGKKNLSNHSKSDALLQKCLNSDWLEINYNFMDKLFMETLMSFDQGSMFSTKFKED